MAIDKDPISFFKKPTEDKILGNEPLDPRTSLTQEEAQQALNTSLSFPQTTVRRGVVPESYERILGEGNYHPEFGYDRTQEMLAQQQSNFGQFTNMLNQGIVGQVVGGSLEGIGYLGAVANLGSVVDGTEYEYGNWLTDIGGKIQTWTEDVTPIYTNPNAPKFDPGKWGWWMSNAPSVFSTLSLMLPAAGVVRGIGMVGKALNIGSKMGRTAKWMATGLGQATVSRHMENMMEASGVHEEVLESSRLELYSKYRDQIKTDLESVTTTEEAEKINSKWERLVEGEAKEKAAKAAAQVYRKQWAMLIQDVPQYLLLNRLGGMGPSGAERSAKVLKKMGMDPMKIYGKKSALIFKDMISEGGEEMYQFLVNEQAKQLVRGTGDPNIKNSLLDVLKDNFDNGELWTSFVFGALGAGFMQAGFAGLNAKAVGKANEARAENINEFGTLYNHSVAVLDDAVESGDPRRMAAAKDNYIFSLGLGAKVHNNVEHAKTFIESMKDPNDDTLERHGIDPKHAKFLAENPEIADEVLQNLDVIDKMYDRFLREADQNDNIEEKDAVNFARSMTQAKFFVDRANKRIEEGEGRLAELTDQIADFNSLHALHQDKKRAEYRVRAKKQSIKKLKKHYEGQKDSMREIDQKVNELMIKQAELELDTLEEQAKEATKAYNSLPPETKAEEKKKDHLDSAEIDNYISEVETIENLKSAVEASEADMEEYRSGRAFKATPAEQEEADEAEVIREFDGITEGDIVNYKDSKGDQQRGIVDRISIKEFDEEGNRVEPDSENALNTFIVQPVDENGKKVGDLIVVSGDKVTLAEPVQPYDPDSVPDDGFTYEEEGKVGVHTAQARFDSEERTIYDPIANLSYSHPDPKNPSKIVIRNDKFNEVISDPKTDMSKARAYYFLDKEAASDYKARVKANLKRVEDSIKKEDKKNKEVLKSLENRKKQLERNLSLVEKLENKELTYKDISFTSGSDYTDFADEIRISVTVVINDVPHTKGLALHESGYDRIMIPSNIRKLKDADERNKRIAKLKSDKKVESRETRALLLKHILNNERVYTEGLRVGRGAPNTLDKSLPTDKRERSVIKELGIKDPNLAQLVIAKSNMQGDYYKSGLRKSASASITQARNVSSTGAVFLRTDNTVNGEHYALKLNKKKISKEHAELIYEAFMLMARSNVTWDKKTQKFKKRALSEEAKKKGIAGRYESTFKKDDPRIAGLKVGEFLDLMVVHGEVLTNPDGPRYAKAKLKEAHKDVLRNKRLYMFLSPGKQSIPYLVFGNRPEANNSGYQVDLRSEKDIRDHKKLFIDWITENKTYPVHTSSKMLNLSINGDFLNGRKFRVGEKGKPGTFVRNKGDNYTAFLLKNDMVTTDAEQLDTGLIFHAPTINLNLRTQRSGDLKLKVDGKNKPSQNTVKPEIEVKDEKSKKSLQTENQRQAERAKKKKEESKPKETEYGNQFNNKTKRRVIRYVGEESETLSAQESFDYIKSVSDIVENNIASGMEVSEIVDNITNLDSEALRFFEDDTLSQGVYQVGQKNKGLEQYLEDRFNGVTTRTLAQEYEYGSTLTSKEKGSPVAPIDYRKTTESDEVGDPVENEEASKIPEKEEEPTTEESTDVANRRADIEKRRNEELEKEFGDILHILQNPDSPIYERDDARAIKAVSKYDRINAKYDAELETLGVSDIEDATDDSVEDIMGDFNSDGLFSRPYTTTDGYTEQDLKREIRWVANKIGIKRREIEVTNRLTDLMVNGRHNWALYSHSAIRLLEAAETGTLYHEAFHRVSLGYLTTTERNKVYRTARTVYKMPKERFTERQVEEKLAEEFREYVLLREKNKPGFIRRVFDEMIEFLRALFIGPSRLTEGDVESLFKDVYRGSYRFAKIKPGNVTNIGAELYQREIQDKEFFTIATRKQYKDLVKNLASRLFKISNIEDLNNISNLDSNMTLLIKDLENKIKRLKNVENNEARTEKERIAASQLRAMFEEVLGPQDDNGKYVDFHIFKDAIENYFTFLGIRRKFNKASDELSDGLDEEQVHRVDSGFGKQDYETSSKENALASIKFLVSTLHESDKADPLTHFQPFVSFNEIWSRLLYDLHDLNTTQEMIDKIRVVGDELDYYPYKELATKLEKSSINGKAQFLVSFKKHRHDFINFAFKGKRSQYTIKTRASGYNELSRSSVLIWNERLILDDRIITTDEYGKRVVVEDYINKTRDKLNKLEIDYKDKIENNNVLTEDIEKVLKGVLDVLNDFNISIDRKSLNAYINEYFNNEDYQDRVYDMVVEIQELISDKIIDSNLIKNPIALKIGESYAIAHPEEESDVNVGPENNRYYTYGLHNLATDVTNKINTDPDWVYDKKNRIYNRRGAILNSMISEEESGREEAEANRKGFGIVTFNKFHRDGGNNEGKQDTGRNFLNINALEDYLIKQAAIFSGYLPFPVMADRKTYFFMKGNLPIIHDILVTSNEDNSVKFTSKVVDQFYDYYKDEEERILEVKKTIDEYNNAEGDVKESLKRRLVENLHYTGDFNTKDANGLNFIHFKGFKVGMDKATFSERLQVVLNDRLKEEIEYGQSIGTVAVMDGGASLTSFVIPQGYMERYEDEELSGNHGLLAAVAHTMINQQIAVFEAEKIFIADPAQFKRTKETDVDVYEDLYKRWFGVGSSGTKFATDIESEKDTFNVLTFEDQPFESSYYPIIFDKHVELYKASLKTKKRYEDSTDQELTEVAEKLAKQRLKAYTEIDPTDGQMFISPNMYRNMMIRLGQWSEAKGKAFDLLQSGKELSRKQKIEGLNVVLKPEKTVYVGHHNHDGIDLLIYDKMSMATLFRQNVEGTHLEEILDRMEGKGKYEGLPEIDAIKFQSAVKVGGMNAVPMYQDGHTRNELTDLTDAPYYEQSFDNLKHQVETDVHDASRQTFGTQAFKLLTSDIHKDQPYGDFETGQELMDAVTRSRVVLSNLGANRVQAKLGIKDGRITSSNLINLLRSDAKSAGKSDDFVQALKTSDETGEKYLELDAFSDRRWVYRRIISLINKETIDLNLPGNQLIQVSDYGMKGKDEKGYRTVEELDFSYSKQGSTDVYEMETRVSARLFRKFIPNFDNLSYKEQLEYVNSNLDILGYRIPTQGQNSIVKLKVVDFLPEQSGDVIHLPLEFTALTGSDFDIDKLFVSTYNYKHDAKNKRLTKIEFDTDKSDEGVDRRYKNKAIELFKIFRHDSNVFSNDEYRKFKDLLKDKSLRGILPQNESYLLINSEAKIDALKLREEAATSPEEKEKWLNLIRTEETNLEHLKDMLDIIESGVDKAIDRSKNELYGLVTGSLVEAGVLPTFEEFKEQTIEEQNTRLANENRLLDIFFTVLTDEKHYLSTSTPLGVLTGNLKDKANKHTTLQSGKKDRRIPSLKMGTPSFQSSTKETYVGSTTGIGAVALANAHHALTQQAGVRMKTNLAVPFNVNNEVKLDRIEGDDGINITSWLSAILDAHVDAVKDPYIMNLNINDSTLNSLVYMIRIGLGGISFDFLAQPILKYYAREFMNNKGSISIIEENPTADTYRYFEGLYIEAGGKAEDIEQKDFYIPLKKLMSQTGLENDLDSKTPRDKEYYRRQLSILKRFEKINEDADRLRQLVMVSRVDTKKFGATPSELNHFLAKVMQMEEKSDEWVNLDKLINSNGEYVEGGTMLGPLLSNSVLMIKNALNKHSLYATPGFNQILFDFILYATKNGNNSDFNTINSLTEELISALFGGYFGDQDIGPGMTTMKVSNLFFNEKTSIFKMINDIRRGTHPHADELKENTFIKALILDFSEDEDVLLKTSIKLPYRTLNDIWESDDYIEAFDELLHHKEPGIRNIGRLLYYYSFFTSGFRNRLYSYNSYIPSSVQREMEIKDPKDTSKFKKVSLNNYIKNLLDKLNQTTGFLEFAADMKREVFTNNWWDDRFVTKIASNAVVEEITDDKGDFTSAYELSLDIKSKHFLGTNKDDQFIFAPYILLQTEFDESILLEYMGLNGDTVQPIYRAIPKKGFQSRGLLVKEYGLKNIRGGEQLEDKSVLPQNNLDKTYNRTQVKNHIQKKFSNFVNIPVDSQVVTNRNPVRDFFEEDMATEFRLEDEQRKREERLSINKAAVKETNTSVQNQIVDEGSIDKTEIENNVSSSDAVVYFATPESGFNLKASRIYAKQQEKPFYIYMPEDEVEDYRGYGTVFSNGEELRQLLINDGVVNLGIFGVRGKNLTPTDKTKFNIMRSIALEKVTKETKGQPKEIKDSGSTALSTSKNPIKIFVDGSVKPGQDKTFNWSRYSDKGYEVSSKGDKTYSAFYATLDNGLTIEKAYQKEKGTGKGKPAKDPNFDYWGTYLGLWEQWAEQNPNLIEELRVKAKGGVLTDQFANTNNNQARALATILNKTKSSELAYGYGSWTNFMGQQSWLSGTNESQEVKDFFSKFPEVKGQNQASPSMELLGTLETLKKFKNTAEHLVILQDNEGVMNYKGLRDRAVDNEGKKNTPWIPNKKGNTPHIEYLVNEILKVMEQIEDNGGSVTLRWVPGHMTTDKIKKYPKALQDGFLTVESYKQGNDKADQAATSPKKGASNMFDLSEELYQSMLSEVEPTNEELEEGRNLIDKCKE